MEFWAWLETTLLETNHTSAAERHMIEDSRSVYIRWSSTATETLLACWQLQVTTISPTPTQRGEDERQVERGIPQPQRWLPCCIHRSSCRSERSFFLLEWEISIYRDTLPSCCCCPYFCWRMESPHLHRPPWSRSPWGSQPHSIAVVRMIFQFHTTFMERMIQKGILFRSK